MKLSRQLFVIHSVIIALLILGYAWLSLLNIRQLTIQELTNQSNSAVKWLSNAVQPAFARGDINAVQLHIDTFYDVGNYSRISIYEKGNTQKTLYHRDDLTRTSGVPTWFVSLLPLEPIHGYRDLYRGIEKIGSLEVETHPYAFYQFVWRQFIDIFSVTIFVGLLAWSLGLALINIVLQPIMAVKRQAAAISHKHYPQISAHSGIAEFEQLIDTHNEMTHQIKVLFSEQQEVLSRLKNDLYHDRGTALANRSYFDLCLSDLFNRQQQNIQGSLLLIHLPKASQLKLDLGFVTYSQVIEFITRSINKIFGDDKNTQLFQLSERDIAVLCLYRSRTEIVEAAKLLATQLENCQPLVQYHGGVIAGEEIVENDTQRELMTRLDQTLKTAISQNKTVYFEHQSSESSSFGLFASKAEMLVFLETARVEFHLQPVLDVEDRNKLFTELYTKFSIDDQLVPLAQILSLAEKFELCAAVDKVIISALQNHLMLGALDKKVSLNVSAYSFEDEVFCQWLYSELSRNKKMAKQLVLEFDEIDLAQCRFAREASYKLSNLGVELAIDHFGRGSSCLSRFSDMKLDWLKIDSRYLQDPESEANRDYLVMICQLVEKLGVKAIMPNIETDAQLQLAKDIQCSGIQGYLLAKPKSLYELI